MVVACRQQRDFRRAASPDQPTDRGFAGTNDDARAAGAAALTALDTLHNTALDEGVTGPPGGSSAGEFRPRSSGGPYPNGPGVHVDCPKARTSMANPESFPIEGGCDCRAVRYRLTTAPLFDHCCHCRWCQRESGASFALNAMIEADRVTELGQTPEFVITPSESGRAQGIACCPSCKIAVWSHYAGAGPWLKFIRAGTLDNPDLLPPDIHIFTASKQPWLAHPTGTPAVREYYERERHWPAESIARRELLLPRILAYQAAQVSGALPLAQAEPTVGRADAAR